MKDIILLILTFFLSLPVSSQISLEIKDNEVLRWDIWHQQKFVNGNSMTEIWGSKKYTNTYIGDYSKIWPIPQAEIEWNSNLKQNSGWY
jgi:hypothetical protein